MRAQTLQVVLKAAVAGAQVENLRYIIQQVPDGIHGARLSPTKKVCAAQSVSGVLRQTRL